MNPVDVPNIRQGTPSEDDLVAQIAADEADRMVGADARRVVDELAVLKAQYQQEMQALMAHIKTVYRTATELARKDDTHGRDRS